MALEFSPLLSLAALRMWLAPGDFLSVGRGSRVSAMRRCRRGSLLS